MHLAKRVGKQSFMLERDICISAAASAVGKKEGESQLRACFDYIDTDDMFGQKNFELGETAMQGLTLQMLVEKTGLAYDDFQLIVGGDLTNQCIATSYAVKDFAIPFLGSYSACSTVTQSLLLAAFSLESGVAERAIALASSHFCTAERQYRFPLDYGAVRTPTSQRTATACGAFALSNGRSPVTVMGGTIGKIEDKGITDSNNMGAAMAYAAYSTINGFFADSQKTPEEFDLIVTGDLGRVGSDMLYELFASDGRDIAHRHIDCGSLMFADMKDVMAGGSGAGCSAAVMAGKLLPMLQSGELKNILFAATGALLSVTSVQQARSIPAISHLVWLSGRRGQE